MWIIGEDILQLEVCHGSVLPAHVILIDQQHALLPLHHRNGLSGAKTGAKAAAIALLIDESLLFLLIKADAIEDADVAAATASNAAGLVNLRNQSLGSIHILQALDAAAGNNAAELLNGLISMLLHILQHPVIELLNDRIAIGVDHSRW